MRYLQLQARSFWIRRGLAVSIFLTAIAAIGTQSRGALIGISAMVIFLWLKSRNKFLILLPIIFVVVAVTLIMPQEWYDRMATIETFEEDWSAITHINATKADCHIAATRITGGGFEAFIPAAIRQYAPNPGLGADAHSIYFEIMAEHGFIGFTMFMLLAWFTWNTGNRIRRLTKRRSETRWATDLAGMIQVSMIGYAASGAFLGLAYFDLYYTLIAIMVVCQRTSMEELARLDGVPEIVGKGVLETDMRPMHERAALIKNGK